MKRTTIIALIAIITGCASQPDVYRTGTICVEPFTTAGFRTSNPIDVKQDIAESIAGQIPEVLRDKIAKETRLTLAPDCLSSDYRLLGAITAIETANEGVSGRRLWGGNWNYSKRSFGLGIQCTLADNRTRQKEVIYQGYEHKNDLMETIEEMAESIAEAVEKPETR